MQNEQANVRVRLRPPPFFSFDEFFSFFILLLRLARRLSISISRPVVVVVVERSRLLDFSAVTNIQLGKYISFLLHLLLLLLSSFANTSLLVQLGHSPPTSEKKRRKSKINRRLTECCCRTRPTFLVGGGKCNFTDDSIFKNIYIFFRIKFPFYFLAIFLFLNKFSILNC